MFITASFMISSIWKQRKWLINTWMDKKDIIYICVYTHATGYYSAIEKNEILPITITGINLEGIMVK